jgi:ankyrin repeat protein
LACENGLHNLTQLLLQKLADPNVQTSSLTNSQTPMHKAILSNHENLLDLFIKHREYMLTNHMSSFLVPDFNIRDTDGQSVLSLCLWANLLNLARRLIGK